MLRKILFEKYQGTENDFIFIKDSQLSKEVDAASLARQICARKTSVGADGLVVISDFKTHADSSSFRWDFYNDDGSEAAMCGNAARCATLFSFYESGLNDCRWLTAIGELKGQWQGHVASVTLPTSTTETKALTLSIDGQQWPGFFVDSGVPHFVIIQEDFHPPQEATALELQSHAAFGSAQANITFVEGGAKAQPRTVSFERGVRQYTRACGTGAIACAKALQKNQGGSQFSFLAPGGPLSVTLKSGAVDLAGPCQRVFQGFFEI